MKKLAATNEDRGGYESGTLNSGPFLRLEKTNQRE